MRKIPKKLSRKPVWMTYKAAKMVRKKHKTYAKYNSKNHPAYRKANKEAKREIKKAKREFEAKLAKHIKDDKKSFFAYVRSKTKTKSRIGTLISGNGTIVEDKSEMAEEFNKFFSSTFTEENQSTIPPSDDMFANRSDQTLDDVDLKPESIRKKLTSLRSDKAPGADGISPWILKEIQESLVNPIYILMRKSLDEGGVPNDWKTANVSPIFKKGSKNSVNNYRPVSLTSQISKIIEAVLRDHIVAHLERFELIKESQHGFRKGRSCLTNLLVFLDKVSACLDEGQPVDVIYLDFAKAFDKVPHKRLLEKIAGHGIRGKVLQWITAWLTNRQQRVCLQGFLSDWTTVISGVPQGSVLGPLLFLIFINDLDVGIENWILKFADDTKVFSSVSSVEEHSKLQKDLQAINRWSEEWQMLFNVDKCKVMHIGKENQNLSYYMDGKQLEDVNQEKDLGIIITNDLKPSAHCTQNYTKANRMLGMIARTFSTRDQHILLSLYKSVVRPHLEYCSPAWSPYYKKDKDLLEKIQHRFTRMFPELRNLQYSERLNKLGLWTLEERRNRADLIEVYKILNGFSVVPVDTFFALSDDTRTRGHSRKLLKRRCNKDLRHHFFSERVVNRWNKLPSYTVDAKSVNQFKSALQKLRTTQIGFFLDVSTSA